MTTVIDTSAMIAWVVSEPGASAVDSLLTEAVMSTVNWSELIQKLLQHGADAYQAAARLQTLGVRIEPFTLEDALAAARLWSSTYSAGLSLADRACLALAQRIGVAAVTADQAWVKLDLSVPIHLIR